MIDELKSKLTELEEKKKESQPKIDELEEQRKNELDAINAQFDKMIADVSSEVTALEKDVFNQLIKSFEKAIMSEFDAKRSTSAYSVTDDIKKYRDFVATLDSYPEEFKNKLDQVLSQEITIEDIAYHIDTLTAKHLKE